MSTRERLRARRKNIAQRIHNIGEIQAYKVRYTIVEKGVNEGGGGGEGGRTSPTGNTTWGRFKNTRSDILLLRREWTEGMGVGRAGGRTSPTVYTTCERLKHTRSDIPE